MMGAGKLGMFIGAPDDVQPIVNEFKGKFEDYGGHRAQPEAKALAGRRRRLHVQPEGHARSRSRPA